MPEQIGEGAFKRSIAFTHIIAETADSVESGVGVEQEVPMAKKTVAFTLVVKAPPDWFLALDQTYLEVVAGAPAIFTVTASAKGGYTGTIALKVNGLPAGVVASISPNPIAQNGQATISIPTDQIPEDTALPLELEGDSTP